jgi:hypothetical protein
VGDPRWASADLAGIDIAVVGVILMVAGALGLLFTALIWGPRSRTSAYGNDETVVREREVY